MSDEVESIPYECVPVVLGDGDIAIHDPEEFAELTESVAWRSINGSLEVLKRRTMRWEGFEPKLKPVRS